MIGPDGRLKSVPVDAAAMAEGFGLDIVGASSRGLLKLQPGKVAELRARENRILIRSTLWDDLTKEPEVREVLAHEVAHFCAHLGYLNQLELPLSFPRGRSATAGRLAFSRSGESDVEKEAIYLAALVQVPLVDLQIAIAPAIAKYRLGKWSSISPVLNQEAESRAAIEYRTAALQQVKRVFQVTDSTAKIALDYWGALQRPPSHWPAKKKEARRTSLR